MSVDENGALVDVGYKSEGIISAQELDRRGVIGSFDLSPGDEIMVYVLSVESGEGSLRLSKRKADEEAAWKNLEQAYREQSIVEAPVAQEVKGGLVVDVGVRAFVPASQVERGYVNDLSKYVGQALRMRVLELDRSKNRVILSQRVVLEEEHERLCKETWDTIEMCIRDSDDFQALGDMASSVQIDACEDNGVFRVWIDGEEVTGRDVYKRQL